MSEARNAAREATATADYGDDILSQFDLNDPAELGYREDGDEQGVPGGALSVRSAAPADENSVAGSSGALVSDFRAAPDDAFSFNSLSSPAALQDGGHVPSVSAKLAAQDWSSAPASQSGSFFADAGGTLSFAAAGQSVSGAGNSRSNSGSQTQLVGENGTADTTAAVAASGNILIDALLIGTSWADGFITYSMPDAADDYQAGYSSDQDADGFSAQNEGFSAFTLQQIIAAHFALNQAIYTQPAGAGGYGIEGFTNLGIDFQGFGVGTGTIRMANTSDAGTAYAFYPNNGVTGGDAWFGNNYDGTSNSLKDPVAGNYAWHTVIHEFGHSLGLKHGHETGGYGALPADRDSLEFTVMTYRTFIGDNASGYDYEQWGAPQTYMMLDIAALQYMYGADYFTNSGDTIYTWDPTTGDHFVNSSLAIDPGGNRIFMTIWDGNGIDTYNLANYTTNLSIDLRPGEHSTFSAAQLAYLGGGPNGGFARGNVFNALLFGGSTASLIENAVGGSGHDTIRGNSGVNQLLGGSGNDTLFGEEGNDVLEGGLNNDVLDGGSGTDQLFGDGGNDRLIQNFGGPNELLHGGDGTDTGDWSYSIGDQWTINLAAGTAMIGATVYADLVSIENVIGGQLNDSITGDGGANRLDGQGGIDSMSGLGGNDTFIVNDALDTVAEAVGGGSDWVASYVTYSLAAGQEIEKLTSASVGSLGAMNLTGNEFAQEIIGNAGANRLDGKGGADTMRGREGNDTYIVDDALDVVVELAGQGTADWVATSTTHALSASAEIEKLSTTSMGSTSAIDLTGSNTAQEIIGNAGNNRIDGKGGADLMRGLGGNDTYIVDNALDVVIEVAGQGTSDWVAARTSYALSATAHIEQLTTTSQLATTAIALVGNDFAQTIRGNNGENAINSRGGNDKLYGNGGNDFFIFDTPIGPGNVDIVFGYSVAQDTIMIDNAVFLGLAAGPLAASAFHIGAAAADALDRIIYNNANGDLLFDSDGSGGAAAVQFAKVSGGLAMTSGEFFVI